MPGPEALATNEPRLLLDGQNITAIAEPAIQDDKILVPICAIAEKLGAEVNWNKEEGTVYIEKDNTSVLLRIDSHLVSYQKDEKTYILSDVPPMIINERIYVSLNLVRNSLGIEADWDADNNSILIDSSKPVDIEPFFDIKISSVNSGQVITGRTDLQIELPNEEATNAVEIKYLLLDPNTAKGTVIARGNQLTSKYSWIPNLQESGERVLVAALYDSDGRFIAGDSIPVYVAVIPEVSLTGLTQDQIITGTVSIGADTNFVASYVKYEITNLDNNKVTVSSEYDPYGPYTWTPMMYDNGSYAFKVIAYDSNNQAYESQTINAKINVPRKFSLSGVSNGATIDKPITLSYSLNFYISQTEYVLRDPKTGKEEILAQIPYGSYKWFPGPKYSGTKELLVRVKDTRGVVHESNKVSVNLTGTPKLFLEGVGPKQVLTGPVKLKVISNVALDKVNYVLINATTGEKKVVASNQKPQAEYTFTPIQGDEGSWKVQAEGIYSSGKKVLSEEIPVTVYLGKTYSATPVIEKDKFLGLASELARDSWEKTGMSAALQTAQAILETGWGQSVPVDKYNGKISYNLFGIKGSATAGSVISNTWEVYNGVSFRVDAEFRAYNNVNESWADHKSLLLEKERYEPFREVMHDSTLGAWAIRRAGYATDPQYPIKLMRLIKQYNLHELDKIGI
ncbi:glucosaminidase domain-containing protein [Proteiniborus sp. MB09-C3]|uniref:glucosaminidase domain-containing protein n=1 Tax=Proteiniborus sp. MB09-C3 TaxID=3050072 RepID=UPI00255734CB|nr:glucosaminidase domain-containing protein [Proteiniborus sp. MB09-C3]WIV13385.1 stalk domain-containing protein [Proteiniborus sp. MB09-C3]